MESIYIIGFISTLNKVFTLSKKLIANSVSPMLIKMKIAAPKMRAPSEDSRVGFSRNGLNFIIHMTANSTWIKLPMNLIYCGAMYVIPKKSKIYTMYNPVIKNI